MPSAPAPTGLPVEACVPALRDALAGAGAAVLQAEPGAGKSTVVPLRLLGEAWLHDNRIVMVEPRRLATRATSRRMAQLLGEEVGATVGYRTRDERHVGRATRIEVVTEGILTRRLQRDPSLPGTGLVIFDEVHERNLQSDLALAFTLDARASLRPDLRVVAMSATLDTRRLAELLGGGTNPASVVAAEGRTYPVEVRWLPRDRRGRLEDATVAAVRAAMRSDEGDVLVFLPGAAEIRRVADGLRAGGNLPRDVDVRPLYGALSAGDQDLALAPSPPGRRRVVLATDIAETSLTVEGVRVVVDVGELRRPRYDRRSGLTKLHTGAASQASAIQRAGRAGRAAPGVAYRLWSEGDHAARRPFAEPEIASVDLVGLALEVAVWGATTAELTFVDQPPPERLAEALTLLERLGAVDATGRPTAAGRAMVDLPIHPRLAHMVLEGRARGAGWSACAMAALLEERDVFHGRSHELAADIGERVRLIASGDGAHPRADRAALATVRRRARELAKRVGVPRRPLDVEGCGPILALAYPDRIAQARGGGRFRLRAGRGVVLATTDPLSGAAFLVVAELGPGPRDRDDDGVRLAAALTAAEVEAVAGDDIVEETTVAWNEARDDLERRTERRLDALVLSSATGPAEPGEEAARALVARVRVTGLGALTWSGRARALQVRAGFARRVVGDPWPDVSDEALLRALDEWLVPRLAAATRRADLARVDVLGVLRERLGPRLVGDLDRVAPPAVVLPSGRSVAIDYGTEPPSVAVRAQELFGLRAHPTVAGGRVALAVHVLSPAGQPIQVTADLPGFWAGSWAEVRRDMISRYPKHNWPADPSTAEPTVKARRGR